VPRFKAIIVKPGLWGLSKKDIRDAGRHGILCAGLYWHDHMKRHHFQLYAFGKYNYKPRAPVYERRKDREHPEAQGRPLVFGGDSERSAMASRTVKATAKSWEQFHADVVINAPTLNYQQLYDEATRVTSSEERTLANIFATQTTNTFLATASAKTTSIQLTQFTTG
jgi:hypothetical protein